MTNVRNPFARPSKIGVDARLLMEDWRHTSEVTCISGTRILDLFTMWTGEAGITGEITRLGWLYTASRPGGGDPGAARGCRVLAGLSGDLAVRVVHQLADNFGPHPGDRR